jgi:hypothetical protein
MAVKCVQSTTLERRRYYYPSHSQPYQVKKLTAVSYNYLSAIVEDGFTGFSGLTIFCVLTVDELELQL